VLASALCALAGLRAALWLVARAGPGEAEPRAVQLAGADPQMLAEAARYNVARGAQIIDINMGCPAKKVLNAACGSALLRDEPLVARIFAAVVAAVEVPVTVKIRTGWDPGSRNAVRIAQLAQDSGVQMLTVHGRTRACGFGGQAEYETIAAVKRAVTIPVVANGDIDSPRKAQAVLAATGADAVMIGRAALGRPWLSGQIAAYLATGTVPPPPLVDEARERLLEHLDDHYRFHGAERGVKSARKHLGWYLKPLAGGADFCDRLNTLDDCAAQRHAVSDFLQAYGDRHERLH
jgi:tRNA-dihydrouridine synthase B